MRKLRKVRVKVTRKVRSHRTVTKTVSRYVIEPVYIKLGEILRKHRIKAGMTQEVAAAKLGVAVLLWLIWK